MKIPDKGRSREDVMAELQGFGKEDLQTRGGRTWAYVYDSGREDVDKVAKEAYMTYLSQNALDPTVYPSTLKLEVALSRMAAAHLGGDENTVGNFTSGGTESCMLSVKTARDYARKFRAGLRRVNQAR